MRYPKLYNRKTSKTQNKINQKRKVHVDLTTSIAYNVNKRISRGGFIMEYLPRVVDDELDLRLDAFGATLIVGPKWCGKTTTGEQKAKSILRMQDPDKREGYLATASTKPSLLLRGENPRLIDEWQVAPVLWDAVRTAVDQRQEEGLFILTGSTSVDNSKIMHSGTGRISRMKMYPMSLFESRESNGGISLRALFSDPNRDIDGVTSALSIEELIFSGRFQQAVHVAAWLLAGRKA
jgi:predicted AAA+ superfamily ATPase